MCQAALTRQLPESKDQQVQLQVPQYQGKCLRQWEIPSSANAAANTDEGTTWYQGFYATHLYSR